MEERVSLTHNKNGSAILKANTVQRFFGRTGSVENGHFIRFSRKSLASDFLMENLNLGIAKMSIIPENPLFPFRKPV